MHTGDSRMIETVRRLMREGFPWAKIALEKLDDWVASQMAAHSPAINMADAWDTQRSDQRVTALYERVFARRSDLLQLQGQAYSRALQFSTARAMREHVRAVIDASNQTEVANVMTAFMTEASNSLAVSGHPLGKGFSHQSEAHAAANSELAGLETSKHVAQGYLQKLSESYEDDLEVLLTINNGPFDYEGRFERQKGLYLNDVKSLSDAVDTHIYGLKLLGREDVFPTQPVPPATESDYVWRIGSILQEISRSYYRYRSGRLSRSLSLVMYPEDGTTPDLSGKDLQILKSDGTALRKSDWRQKLQFLDEDLEFFFSVTHEMLQRKLPGMTNFRLVAIGLQWIADNTEIRRDVSEAEASIRARLAAAYRPIRVDGSVTPPRLAAERWQPPAIEFANSVTTYHDLREVTAEDGFGITGLPVEGRWQAVLKRARLRGITVARDNPFSGVDLPNETPSIQGLILHLRVTCERA